MPTPTLLQRLKERKLVEGALAGMEYSVSEYLGECMIESQSIFQPRWIG
jgi:hypothetical protein